MQDAGKLRPDASSGPGEADPELAALDAVHVVLVGTTHPGNIGAAARAMKTMGLRRLVLVRPERFPNAEASARASGADDLLARARVTQTLDEAVAPCTWVVGTSARVRHIRWPEVDARGFAAGTLARAGAGPVAVVFGREDSGLSNAELDRCQAVLRLPVDPSFASLNLAAAVQVVAYELRMAALDAVRCGGAAASEQAPAGPASVTREDMDGFHRHLEQALSDIGYFDPAAPRLLPRRLRRMFNRMDPDRAELNILRGILTAAQRHVRRR